MAVEKSYEERVQEVDKYLESISEVRYGELVASRGIVLAVLVLAAAIKEASEKK